MLEINSWQYYNPVKISFGQGERNRLSDNIAGKSVLLVTTPGFTSRGLTEEIVALLAKNKVIVYDRVMPNPEVEVIDRDFEGLCCQKIETIVAVGGGSVLDTAKAFAYLASLEKPFSLKLSFEEKTPMPDVAIKPIYAVPTTSGTGSEVTPFATLWNKKAGKKYSLATTNLYPAMALLDPELTLRMPRNVSIDSGLDALSHALESLWNKNANLLSRLYAGSSAVMVIKTLTQVVENPADLEARGIMMKAAMLGGLAISTTRTALAHSISYPITAFYGVPHGLACSICLPEILEFNAQADDGGLRDLAVSLGCASMAELKQNIVDLYVSLGVYESFNSYISNRDALLTLVPEMFTPGRADNNIRPVKGEDIESLLKKVINKIDEKSRQA